MKFYRTETDYKMGVMMITDQLDVTTQFSNGETFYKKVEED